MLSACGPRAPAPTTPVLAPAPTETIEDAPAAGAPAETYVELVRQVAAREGAASPQAAACVLEQVGDLLRYGAGGLAAVRPLPLPSADLDAQLARSVSVNVLTGFGRYGNAPGSLSLAAYTTVAPTREALALIVTDSGIALRGVEASVPLQNQLSRNAAVEAAVSLQPAAVFVAAEAGVSTPLVSELLSALLGRHVPVALAVDLPPEAALPSASPSFASCPNGLDAGDEPEGNLTLAQIRPSIAELGARASECLAKGDARGAAGGRVRVVMRVGPAGNVTQACISADDTRDPKLLACITAQARGLRFPAPTPSGNVDLELPLALAPAAFAPLPLLCEAALRN
ncbi:MAG TPA: hypothetical protein VFZ61_01750 [Polyangiales bacterium]